MPDNEIAAAGQRVFELFAACAADPDDAEVGKEADAALHQLDRFLDAIGDDARSGE